MSTKQPDARDVDVIPADPCQLVPYETNARTHSDRQIDKLARSIETFGFTNPVLTDGENGILAGHGRVIAAIKLGLKTVPTIPLAHLSPAQRRAYILADNRLAEDAGWDRDLLRLELGALELDADEIELTDTGFEIGEIDQILLEDEPTDAEDAVPEPEAGPAVTQPGDVWVFAGGDHKLICGNALEADDLAALMGEDRAQLLLTDPPYNVKVDGHVGGLGKVKHAEFAFASGEMDKADFTSFLTNALAGAAGHLVDGALAFVFMDWRHVEEMMAAGGSAFDEFKNICVWAKTNGGMGSLYRSAHEFCFIFKSGSGAHINTVELGRHGRNRTNVWSCAGANSFSASRAKDLADHPTVKPVGLLADAILDVTRRGDIVLDVFGGSGSTLMAAQRTGRRSRLVEYEPRYCDVTVRRWIERYDDVPVLAETGETFDEVAARRAVDAIAAEAEAPANDSGTSSSDDEEAA